MDRPEKVNAELEEPDLSGRQLGDFYILRRLGQGAMAVVYLAEQLSLKRRVALKVLKRSLATDQTYVKRFQREAQAAAALVHSNIVQIYEVGHTDGVYFIAQEYVQGLNLRQWVERNGAPDLRLALLIMRQVVAALAKAAEHGIVHRDIKPENVMLTRSGEVKVADFGLARLQDQKDAVEMTEVGITVGTPLYMSPEQVEGRPLDSRSDLYSFGVTCYQMLAGRPPFSGETALSVALQHLNKLPEPLENHRPDLPPALCRTVHKMLAKNPEHRFQSPQELLRELRRLQQAHLGEQWAEDIPAWDTLAPGLPGLGPNEATQRLQAVMKAQSGVLSRGPHWAVWACAAAVCFLLGGAAAYILARPRSILAQAAEAHPPAPQYENALRQYLYASQVGTLEAWQSVIDYFPDKRYYVNRAKQQKARIYLRQRDYDRALDEFGDLAALDHTEPELRAFGLIGQAAVLTMQGKYQESANILVQHLPALVKIEDPEMKRMLQYVLRRNRSELGPLSPPEWEKLLKEEFGEHD
ncbi:MAG: serine/threonine protein kinase [Thermoguttaceae bacterium]